MKILIIDDEKLSLMRLKRLLNESTDSIIFSATSAYEAIKVLEKNPDIEAAFVDIKMPDMSGLELAYRLLGINENLFVVFQTAYDEYALEAFKVGAIDYIVKPYTQEEIRRVLSRIDKFREAKKETRFMVKTLQGHYMIISPSEIFYIKAELKESMIRTRDDYIYYPLSISAFEEKLKNHDFFRVHKSYLINVRKISRINRTLQSKLIFRFSGIDDVITSSKDGARLFREKYGWLSFSENQLENKEG